MAAASPRAAAVITSQTRFPRTVFSSGGLIIRSLSEVLDYAKVDDIVKSHKRFGGCVFGPLVDVKQFITPRRVFSPPNTGPEPLPAKEPVVHVNVPLPKPFGVNDHVPSVVIR